MLAPQGILHKITYHYNGSHFSLMTFVFLFLDEFAQIQGHMINLQ